MNPAILVIIGAAYGMMPGAFVRECARTEYGPEYNRDFYNANRRGRPRDERAKGRNPSHWKRRAMPY